MKIWSEIKNREDLQTLFREVKPMTPENVKKGYKLNFLRTKVEAVPLKMREDKK